MENFKETITTTSLTFAFFTSSKTTDHGLSANFANKMMLNNDDDDFQDCFVFSDKIDISLKWKDEHS